MNGRAMVGLVVLFAVIDGCRTVGTEPPPAMAGEAAASNSKTANSVQVLLELEPLRQKLVALGRGEENRAAREATSLTYAKEARRLLRKYSVDAADVGRSATVLTDPDARASLLESGESAVASSRVESRFGAGTSAELRSVRAPIDDLARNIAGAAERPIDCSRQPDSCACTDCGHSCDENPAYRVCLNDCLFKMGACIIGAPPAALACAAEYATCTVDCGNRINPSSC